MFMSNNTCKSNFELIFDSVFVRNLISSVLFISPLFTTELSQGTLRYYTTKSHTNQPFIVANQLNAYSHIQIYCTHSAYPELRLHFPWGLQRKYFTIIAIRHAGYLSSLFPAGTPSCKRVFLWICTTCNPLKSSFVVISFACLRQWSVKRHIKHQFKLLILLSLLSETSIITMFHRRWDDNSRCRSVRLMRCQA